MAHVLDTKRVEKPWGRRELAPLFADQPPGASPVGEIWFPDVAVGAHELLVKYLFTGERLSVQVHPDDRAAQARGYPRGKDEAWVVLAAEPDAVIALGLKTPMSGEAVRAAALDGSIEELLDWRPVKPGDVIYSRAGTIHAIGEGLSLIEIQQNLDVTYRFYDYGSDRELHLDDAIAVADLGPFQPLPPPRACGPGREILAENVAFVFERWMGARDTVLAPGSSTVWIMPVQGAIRVEGVDATLGSVIILDGAARLQMGPDALAYFAYPGSRVITGLDGSGIPPPRGTNGADVTG